MTGEIPEPSTSDQDAAIDVIGVCRAMGMPDRYITDAVFGQFMVASLAGEFSDGEIELAHDPVGDPVLQEYFGLQHFTDGVFGRRVRELFEGKDETMRGKIDMLVRDAAHACVSQVMEGIIELPPVPSVQIDTVQDLLIIDGLHKVPLLAKARAVIDYGPGVHGRFHIRRQVMDINKRRNPFVYMPFCKGPFINEFLLGYWAARLKDKWPVVGRAIIGGIYTGREDGLAAASATVIQNQQEAGEPTEIADLILMSGVHAAGRAELEVGIQNAHQLLKADGALLIRAPEEPSPTVRGALAAAELIEMAFDSGFPRSKVQYLETPAEGKYAPPKPLLSGVLRK